MSSEGMHIVYCTDTNYIMPIGVAMISVCENNKDENITFHIFITDMEATNEVIDTKTAKLKEVANKYNQTIEIYHFDFEKLRVFGHTQFGHISIAALVRLYIADLLPDTIDRVMYMDGDTLVNDKLRPLWETEMAADCPLAAVVDANGTSALTHYALKTPVNTPYINSGVLLINLSCWRQEKSSATLISVAKEKLDTFPYIDQDLINYVFGDRIKLLPIKYNFQTIFIFSPEFYWMVDCQYVDEIRSLIKEKNPVIIHYITANKPWKDEWCPLREIWNKYKALSPWKDVPVESLVTRFDRCDIYDDFIDAYWGDTKLMKALLRPVIPLAKTILKFKNKEKIANVVTIPLRIATVLLERIYRFKARKLKNG